MDVIVNQTDIQKKYTYKYHILEIQLSRGDDWDTINRSRQAHYCAGLKPEPGFPQSQVVVFPMFIELSLVGGNCLFC